MAHKDRARAEIVYNGSLASKVRTLSGIITAKTSILLGVILQGVGMTLGYFAAVSYTHLISSCSWHRYSSAAMVLVVMFDHPFRLQGAPGQTSVSPVPLL